MSPNFLVRSLRRVLAIPATVAMALLLAAISLGIAPATAQTSPLPCAPLVSGTPAATPAAPVALPEVAVPDGATKIAVGYMPLSIYAPIYVAYAKGYYAGQGLDVELQSFTKKDIIVNIKEIRKAEVDAQLVAENVAFQLQRRVAFRRAMKRCITSALKLGAAGIKIACAGRLGGAEMARREWYRNGRVPLHTIRADVDYGFAQARTTYGVIGVKVWIFKGEVLTPREVTTQDV